MERNVLCLVVCVNLVDVHRETVDDGVGYQFEARLDHFCTILTEEDYVILQQ